MSGTLIPMGAQGINPLPTQQALAGIGLQQAQTGLIGQQAQAAAIQNALTQTRMGVIFGAYGIQNPFGGQGAQAAIPGSGGYGIAGHFGLPGQSGAGAPQGSVPTSEGQLPPEYAAHQVSPYGAVQSAYGVPVPWYRAFLADTSTPDPIKAGADLIKMRAVVLHQLIQSVPMDENGNVGDINAWHNALHSAYAGQWIDGNDIARLWNHPEQRQQMENSFANPDEVLKARVDAAGKGLMFGSAGGLVPSPLAASAAGMVEAQKAWAKVNPAIATATEVAPIEAGAKAQYETVAVPITNPDGTISMKTMTRAQAAQQLGQPTGAVGLGGTSALSYGSPLTRAAAAGESGGNPAEGAPPGTPGNPHPTAGGAYQWTDQSWTDAVNKFAPQVAAGKSQADLMALKNNLPFANAITEASFGANAAALTNNGYLSNNATVLLAHHYGLAGAQTILRAADASPNATLKQVLPDAAEANPTEANLTMQQIAQHWSGLAKGAGLDPNAPYAPPQPQQSAGPGAPATAASSGSPAPGTVGMGPAKFTPTQNVTVGLNQKAIDEGEKYSSDLQDAAATAAQTQVTMRTLANVAAPLPTGALGTVKGQIANYLASFGGDWSDKFMKATTGIDANSANAYQETAKIALQIAGMAENKSVGARGSMGLTNIFLRTFPGLETQPGALQHMANLFSVQSQYNIDHADTVSGYYLPQRDAFKQNPIAANVQPPVALDRRFLDQKGPNAPQVYSAAAGALNDVPYAQWTKGLAPDQIVAALKVAGRSNPTGHVLGPDGTPHIFQTAQAQ